MAQRLWLLLEGADDVTVIEDAAAMRPFGPTAWQGDDGIGAKEAFEAVVEEVHLQLAADQPGRHGVEHAVDADRAVAGHRCRQRGEVGGAVLGQLAQPGPLGGDQYAPGGMWRI